MQRSALFVLLPVLAACGGGAPPVPAPAAPPKVAKAAAPPAPRSSDTLRRSDVVAWVDAGFGRFLQQVAVEPSLEAGRFRGWLILDLRPRGFWESVDLKPGDVVTAVNGRPIERELEAWGAFESLRTASEIRVTYQRGNAARDLAYRIVD